MNNNRLSTSSKPIGDRKELDVKIQTLSDMSSNFELREGRVWIIAQYFNGARKIDLKVKEVNPKHLNFGTTKVI